jgi:hypothetical protein
VTMKCFHERRHVVQCDDENHETVFDDEWKRRQMRSNVNVDDTSFT